MKFAITNFYNVRFLTANQIPISTAIFDPKWFHDFKGRDYVFKDKNGVWNGLRYEAFAPGFITQGFCRGQPCHESPNECRFLKYYADKLNRISFDVMLAEIQLMVQQIQTHDNIEGEIEVVLLVHEKIDNPCSERWPLIEFFRSHGVEIRSF